MPALGCLRDAAMLIRFQRVLVACLVAALISTTAAFAPSASAAGAIPIRYTYDANGRLSSVIDPAAGSAAYSYDATGNITAITRRTITTLSVLEVAPDGGPVGTNVSIDGTAFSATPSLNTVKFNGTTAVVVSASTTEIVATVPAGATTGTVTVKVGNTTATSATTFKVGSTVPTITSFSPTIAVPNTTVTITGTNFETAPAFDAVRVNLLLAKVTAATATSLTVKSPPASSGHVTVSTPGGSVTTSSYLYVPPTGRTVADIDDTRSATVGGAAVTANVTHAGNDALVVFDGAQNSAVSWLFSNVTLTNTVTILGPDGSVVRGSQSAGTGTFFDTVTLPVTGTYTVWIDGAAGATGNVGVQVLGIVNPSAVGTIDGPQVSVTTTVAGQNGLVTFDGIANQVIALQGSRTPAGFTQDEDVRVLNPDGTPLVNSFGTGTSNSSWFTDKKTLPTTGTYTVVFDPRGTDKGTSSVTIWTVPADATATATIDGPQVSVTTTVGGQNASITFEGTQDQVIGILFNRTPAGFTQDEDVKVLNPDQTLLINTFGTGSSNNNTFSDKKTLPATGTYTIVYNPRETDKGTSSVTIWTVPADATATATIDGPQVSVTTTVGGQNAKVTFDGALNQIVAIQGTRTPAGFTQDEDVKVVNPDQTPLINNFGVSNSGFTRTVTLPATGTYTIVFDPRGTDTGTNSVQVTNQGGGALPAAGTFVRYVSEAAGGPNSGTGTAGLGEDLGAPASRPTGEPAEPGASPPKAAPPPPATGPEAWDPTAANLHGDWRSGRPRSAWEDQPPLIAKPGITALSGLVLNLRGEPLAGVTLRVGDRSAVTDSTGRFLIDDIDATAKVLDISGATANRAGRTYGFFEAHLDTIAGRTTALPYTIWMPVLDTAHTVAIPKVTSTEVVVTTPKIPGLELHIPAGTSVTDEAGNSVTEIGITPIPIDRTPFPLPVNSTIPVYFTIQPGGAYLAPKGAWLVYPNYIGASPGASIDFFQYEPEIGPWHPHGDGWRVYGQGTVTADGKSVVPDARTKLWAFTGAMINDGNTPPGTGPAEGSAQDGDPVDLGTGLFVLSKTDVSLDGVMPLTVTRTYRQSDPQNRAFGKGANWNFGMFLWAAQGWGYLQADLVLPDGGRIHYVRTSAGTGFPDAVYESTATPTAYYKSTIRWNGHGWDLRLRDGTVYVFGENQPLQSIRDRYGNRLNLIRQSGQSGNVTQITSSSGRWVTLAYDVSNRITSITDNTGRVTGYTYDANQYLWKVTDPNLGVTEYTYDASGRMKTLKDARLITFLTNDYYADGKVQKQTQADGTTYQFTYSIDGSGHVTQTDVTDPRGTVRRITFDLSGYPLTETFAFGTSQAELTTYVRQASGELPTSVTDALGRRTDVSYNAAGDITMVTRLAGTASAVSTTTTRDPNYGQVRTTTDPLLHVTAIDYFSDGSLKSTTDGHGKTTTYTSNTAGQATTYRDPTNKVMTLQYDNGDRTGVLDPVGNRTRVFVDAAGRASSVTDAIGNQVRTDYDVLNRPVKVTDPVNGMTQLGYDANANVLTMTDARTGVTTYTYDLMDRPATRKDALLRTESYLYDANGNLSKVTDRAGIVTTYQYDSLNRETFAGFKTLGSAPNFTYESTITYTYDAGNRLRTATDSAAGLITIGWDDLDRQSSESSPQGAITYGYDDASRRTAMTLSGQPLVTYGYDDANRLTSINQSSAAVGLTYDDAGRLLTTTLPNGVVGTTSYDDASHLTSISYAKGVTTIGDLTYAYDAAGRRVTAGGSLARITLPTAVGSTIYNADNQLTKWNSNSVQPTYDVNGNMLTDGTYSYTWNARNQLTQLKQGATVVSTYAYDAFGRRISKTVSGATTGFAYDSANFVQEKNASGTPTANMIAGGTDQTFSRTDSVGARYLLTDALGSTVALTDAAGVVQTSYTYEPFGKAALTGAANGNSQQFTGRESDGPLYYYRARFLHPTFGRFVNEDPGEFLTSGPNLYAYAGDNPTNLVDPSGMFGIIGLLGGCALGIAGYFAGNWISNNLLGHRDCPTPAGVVGACVSGGISGAFGGLDLFGRLFANAALGLGSNFFSQVTSGAAQNRRFDPAAYVISGVVGAVSGATPAGGVGQGLVVSGLAGVAAPVLEQGWNQIIGSFKMRGRGLLP